MIIQRGSSGPLASPKLTTFQLLWKIVEREASGLRGVAIIAAVSCTLLTTARNLLQPEFVAAWTNPALRLALFGVIVLSMALFLVEQAGWLSKQRLLDLGMVFQV